MNQSFFRRQSKLNGHLGPAVFIPLRFRPATMFIFPAPLVEFILRIFRRQEAVNIQAFVPQTSVKRFNKQLICSTGSPLLSPPISKSRNGWRRDSACFSRRRRRGSRITSAVGGPLFLASLSNDQDISPTVAGVGDISYKWASFFNDTRFTTIINYTKSNIKNSLKLPMVARHLDISERVVQYILSSRGIKLHQILIFKRCLFWQIK